MLLISVKGAEIMQSRSVVSYFFSHGQSFVLKRKTQLGTSSEGFIICENFTCTTVGVGLRKFPCMSARRTRRQSFNRLFFCANLSVAQLYTSKKFTHQNVTEQTTELASMRDNETVLRSLEFD